MSQSREHNDQYSYPYDFNKDPFKEAGKLVCCDEVTIPPNPDGGNDCVDLWKEQLRVASNQYDVAAAQTSKAEQLYVNAFAWQEKLKKWDENITTANEKADGICIELDLFIQKVESATVNSDKTSISAEALLCLVKKIFDCIVELCRQKPPAEEVGLIQELRVAVECLENVDERDKQTMLTCIGTFEEKIKKVHTLQADVLNKMLELLNCAYLLSSSLGYKYGLLGQLQDLKKRIQGETTHVEQVHSCIHEPNDPKPEPPCGDDVLKQSVKLFPIKESEYAKRIVTLYGEAKSKADQLKGERATARLASDRALARRESLKEAVAAAEKAEKAK